MNVVVSHDRLVDHRHSGGWPSMVLRNKRSAIDTGLMLHLDLRRHRSSMRLPDGRNFRRARAQLDAAIPAIEADPVVVVYNHIAVVDVVHHRDVDIVDTAVIEEVAGVPVATLIARPHIAEAIVHAAVEADVRAPVAVEEAVAAVGISPVAGVHNAP